MQRTPRSAPTRPKNSEPSRSKKLANAGIIGLSVVLAGGLGLLWMQDEQAEARNAESVSSYTPPTADKPKAEVIRFAAVGDSITEANSPDIVERRVGNASWVSYAESKTTRFAGGWADGGARTDAMRENFKAVPNADVLVVLAGANDVAQGIAFEETTSNISAIVEEAKAPRVLVSSIPPQEEDPGRVVTYNRELEQFTRDKGWDWVDAAAGLRDGDRYAEGMSEDGVHPTQKGAKILGDALQEAISAE